MESEALPQVPFRVRVKEVVSSRYPGHERPEKWDGRTSGVDVIQTTEGQKLRLESGGQQSPPQENWEILVTGGDNQQGFTWTLYGIPKGAKGRA